jgi:N-acylneuraminate cytidylyltransferase
MAKICIIPARGGSKRILRKNIKLFLGKPIIAYSIEAALESGLFDEVMVSTDDLEIAEIAKKYGAKIPFLRSHKTADDFATTFDVIEEVLKSFKSDGAQFEYTCCLYATSPFVTSLKLKNAFLKMKSSQTDAVFTVLEYSYPIQRSLEFVQDNLQMKWPENIPKRSQDLSKSYHDAGQFYMYKTEKYLEKRGVFKMKSSAIILSELEAQDIDTETDWKLAEMKMELMLNE